MSSGTETQETNYALKNWFVKSNKKKSAATKREPKNLQILEKYIKGQGSRPKFFRKAWTLISENHSEWAQNKPLFKWFINDKSILTLVDSGAESNIIDAGLLKEFEKRW